jgi:hypothetical protein
MIDVALFDLIKSCSGDSTLISSCRRRNKRAAKGLIVGGLTHTFTRMVALK